MFIECVKNNGKPYLRLVRSVVTTSKKDPSKRYPYKKIEKSIGPLEKFDDGKPDYLKRLKQSFVDGKPLIKELEPFVGKSVVNEGASDMQLFKPGGAFIDLKCAAALILDKIFADVGLKALCAEIKHRDHIPFDLDGWLRLALFGRLLNPASKIATAKQAESYIYPLLGEENFSEYHVYDLLDALYENRQRILTRLNNKLTTEINRDTSILYYDVTNFFFEIDEPDPDVTDPNGDIVKKGLRKVGVSKENRKTPIVQMSLFLDNSGIPVGMEMFPGNTLDHLTAVPGFNNVLKPLNLKSRFIYIADRGICTGPIMCALTDAGNGYIISKSIRKSRDEFRSWILNQDDYTEISDNFKYKSKVIEVRVKDRDGNIRTIKQKSVVYWSRGFYERERAAHKSFLEFLDKLIKSPNSFRVTASQYYGLRRFLDKTVKNIKTGETINSSALRSQIDLKKVEEFTDLMGYYQIRTSEIDMPCTEIIDKYHGLNRIENQFAEMKGTLETRPIYVRTAEHIHAHLLLCTIALIMMRLIQRKITKAFPPAPDDKRQWTYGMSGQRIKEALQKFEVERTGDKIYRFRKPGDDLITILKAWGIELEERLYTQGELLRLKNSLSAF